MAPAHPESEAVDVAESAHESPPGDPVRLVESAGQFAPLLRAYHRWSRPPDAESAAAWLRLRAAVEQPSPAPRRRPMATVCTGLAGACLAGWLLAPVQPGDEASLTAAGGTSGSAVASGGAEGTSGVRPRGR